MLSPSISRAPDRTYSGGVAIIARALPSVVFPQPDSPASPRISPSPSSRETPSTAVKSFSPPP